MSSYDIPAIVYTLPCFEPATCIWSNAAKNIVPRELQSYKVEVIILYGGQATPENIHKAMKQANVKMLRGVGHGNSDKFTAQNYSIVYWTAHPEQFDELKDKNFSPVSCLVGKSLLPAMAQHGLGAGIGETIEYGITSNGIDDFVYAELAYTIWLLRGHTHKEAYEHMLEAYKDKADQAETRGDIYTARLLRADAKYRKAFGNDDWRITKPQQPPQPPQPPAPHKVKVKITIPQTTIEGYITWEQE